jgi:hypothetical protein
VTVLLCKNIIVAKSKEAKTRCNLAESSKEDHGSHRAVLSMMMFMMTFNCTVMTLNGKQSTYLYYFST